jgi:zinc transport system ATP-binding protein
MQRMLLARALINQPNLLVLDEPVQGVDIQGQTERYHYINEIRNRTQCGVLMVSHDLHIVMKTTDQVICLNNHICCSGTPQSIHDHPEYQALFGTNTEEIALYEHRHDSNTCQLSHGQPPQDTP